MKYWHFFLFALTIPILVNAQIRKAEITTTITQTTEMLAPEEGSLPPVTDVSFSEFLGRVRLQNRIGFPVMEFRHSYKQNKFQPDYADVRLGAILPLPVKNMYFKGIVSENNPEDKTPVTDAAGYVINQFGALVTQIGVDYEETPQLTDRIYSINAKYSLNSLILLGGFSSEPDSMERFCAGAIVNLPAQFVLGGIAGFWEDETGFAVNFGRYNKPGDFGGAPSFALNHIEVPQTYKWTNLRIMWGDRGGHYVPPTFENPLFGGMHDLNTDLMLKELTNDNYRHFESPLLFRRYNEYGTVALRVNYLDLESGLRKLDVNVNYNSGLTVGPFAAIGALVSYGRLHLPVFGWQNDRMHFNVESWLFNKVLCGVTWSSDFDEYQAIMAEFRIQTDL